MNAPTSPRDAWRNMQKSTWVPDKSGKPWNWGNSWHNSCSKYLGTAGFKTAATHTWNVEHPRLPKLQCTIKRIGLTISIVWLGTRKSSNLEGSNLTISAPLGPRPLCPGQVQLLQGQESYKIVMGLGDRRHRRHRHRRHRRHHHHQQQQQPTFRHGDVWRRYPHHFALTTHLALSNIT